MKDLQHINLNLLNKFIEDTNYIFIDIRSSDSFNGWKLKNEKLSGHINGAKNFYFQWNYSTNLKNFLEKQNINKHKELILCYSTIGEVHNIYNSLIELGYKNLLILDMTTLSVKDSKYILNYKNYKYLIPTELVIENPAFLEDFQIFHVGFGPEEKTSYKGHLKGSIYINTDEIEPPPEWKLASPELLRIFARKYNIKPKSKILVTGWNQMASYRVATTLMYMGIEDVRVLNGGFELLEKLNYKFEKHSNLSTPSKTIEESIPSNKNFILSIDELKSLLGNSNFTLLDNRTYIEHIGENSGYNYHMKKGRIPNSVYGHAGFEGPHSLEYYRNIDNTMKSKEDIESLWIKENINLDNHLAFMCGSGWRASEVFFYAHILGYTNISIYSDGWIGWSKDSQNPIESGIPK